MRTPQTVVGMVSPILFFVAGIFWVGIIVTGGGLLLLWAALTCFLSGIFLFTWASSWVAKPLIKATSVFGLTLTVYQLYVGLSLFGTGLESVAAITAGLFAALTAIYLYLLFFARVSKKEA